MVNSQLKIRNSYYTLVSTYLSMLCNVNISGSFQYKKFIIYSQQPLGSCSGKKYLITIMLEFKYKIFKSKKDKRTLALERG